SDLGRVGVVLGLVLDGPEGDGQFGIDVTRFLLDLLVLLSWLGRSNGLGVALVLCLRRRVRRVLRSGGVGGFLLRLGPFLQVEPFLREVSFHAFPEERTTRLESDGRSEEHASELQSHFDLVCRLLLEKKKDKM